MTEWYLEVSYIPPEMSGLEAKKCITGPIDQINRIMQAVIGGRLDE